MTSAALELRPMEWTDIDRLVALERVVFPEDAWSAQAWWAELAARPRRSYAVARACGGLVGYAGVDDTGGIADVMTLAVDPAHRHRGVGQRLLDWVFDQARDMAAEAIMLEVRADNTTARKLYGRNGFEEIRVRRGYYQPSGADALVLRARPGREWHGGH